jgi:hypothetical protein
MQVLAKVLINKKKMSTTDTKERILVWTKTERAGDIVTVDKIDGDFTLFTDGTRCYTNIIGEEFFMEAKTEQHANQLAVPFKGPSNTPVAPKKGPDGPQPTAKVNGELNVMLEMLKKISAKNTITMPLELKVPSKEVYDLFKDQMDITKADLNEQILLLVESQINNLQEQLKPQAEEFIKTYYNGRTSKLNTGIKSKPAKGGNAAPSIEY